MKIEMTPYIKEYFYNLGENILPFSQKKHSIFKEFKKTKIQTQKNSIFLGINNYDFSDGFDGENNNKKETNNNHIIPCSYFSQWTKLLTRDGKLINKDNKPRYNKITYKGKNTYLENFMQIDYAFVNYLEDMFLKG